MTMGDTTRPAREWMLRAQFEQLASVIPAEMVDRWPLPTAKLAVKMHHWQPSVARWDNLIRWSNHGADANAMASEARDAIWVFHSRPRTGDFSLEAIEARFQRRALRAGVGRLTFHERPE